MSTPYSKGGIVYLCNRPVTKISLSHHTAIFGVVFWRVHALYLSADCFICVTSLSVVSYDGYSAHASDKLHMHFLQGDDVISRVTSVLDSQVSCIVLGTIKDNYDMSASVFVVQFNGFMSLTS